MNNIEKRSKKEQEAFVINFDKAVSKEKEQSIKLEYDGKTYELPATPPMWFPLEILRHADKKGNIPDDKMMLMIERLMGKGFAKKISEDNFISVSLVEKEIIEPMMKKWGFTEAKAGKK